MLSDYPHFTCSIATYAWKLSYKLVQMQSIFFFKKYKHCLPGTRSKDILCLFICLPLSQAIQVNHKTRQLYFYSMDTLPVTIWVLFMSLLSPTQGKKIKDTHVPYPMKKCNFQKPMGQQVKGVGGLWTKAYCLCLLSQEWCAAPKCNELSSKT